MTDVPSISPPRRAGRRARRRATPPAGSYTPARAGLAGRAKEWIRRYRFRSGEMARQVESFLANARFMARTIEEELGAPLSGLDILEIGPDRKTSHLYYFARDNRYTGVDLEAPPEPRGASVLSRLLGAHRPASERRVHGGDAAFERELGRRIDIRTLTAERHHMDPARLAFEDGAFDVAFSISVFEHLSDVRGVMAEIARVLRPGGVAYAVTHLYTSDTGIHDPRLFGRRDDIPYWSHLRPRFAHLVTAGGPLNRLRLADYLVAFEAAWPGAKQTHVYNGARAGRALAELRAHGELSAYSDEELMTDAIVTVWRKPELPEEA